VTASQAQAVVQCVFSGTPGLWNYQCTINNALVTDPRESVLIARVHPAGGTDALVRIVEFRNNSVLSHIPNELFTAFPGIVTLNAGLTNLSSIGWLRNCQNLQTLTINHNRLTELPTRSISACNNLVTIAADHNQITDLDPWLLRSFRNFLTLNMDDNQITQIRFRALLTASTRTGLTINLSNNPIQRIEGNFDRTANFANLLFGNCQIDEIDRNFLNNVVGTIGTLNMTGNRCISMSFTGINPTTLPGISPFFNRCFLNFDQARTTRPPPPTEPTTWPGETTDPRE
jgi:hypothetical protein